MARNLDIESLIEDAFISELPNWIPIEVDVKSWDDLKYTSLTPMIKIKATYAEEQVGTVNFFIASNVIVDFGVFTSKKIDENGRIANNIRGNIRSLLNESNIVDLLNVKDGLLVYSNGVIPSNAVDVSDDKLWQKNLSVLVVATTDN